MSIVSLSIYVFLLYLCFRLDYDAKHPFLMIWLYNIPFVVIPGVYAIYFSTYDLKVVSAFFIFSSLCQLVYLGSSLLMPSTKLKYHHIKKVNTQDFRFVAFFCFYIPLFLSAILFILNFPSFVDSRGSYLQMFYAYSIMYLVGFWYYFKSKSKIYVFIIFLIFSFQILVFKSRGSFSYIVMPFVFFMVSRGISFKVIFKLFSIVTVLFFCIIILKSYRWASNSGGANLSILIDGFFYIFSVLFTKGELSLINHAFFVFDLCSGDDYICNQATTVDKLIASRFFDYSVSGAAYQIWDLITHQYGVGGSLHSLSYGVAFFDLKYYGVLYFLALSFMRLLTSYILTINYGLLIIGPLMYFCLFFSRGSVYNSIVPFLISVFLFFCFYFLFFLTKKTLFSK